MTRPDRIRQLRKAIQGRYVLIFVFLWEAALRVVYFAVTPYQERTYDTQGHIDYIIDVVRTFRIPATGAGWETHQPPLYYFLAASWVKIGLLLGRATAALSGDLRLLSLVLSLGTLVTIIWIGVIIFPKKTQRWQAALFALVAGTLPGIAMASSRINNDTLSFLFAFLWCAFALRWWSQGKSRDFWIATVILGLGILTKLTIGALIVPMGLMVITRKNADWKRKIRLLAGFGLALTLLCGWYFVLRSISFVEGFFTSGSSTFNEGIILENRPLYFLLFNPLALLQLPFANPWDPLSGREYMWEYLFRTAFFGEWTFAQLLWIGKATIAVGLVGLVAAVTGVVRTWRSWEFSLPSMYIALALPAALLSFRILHPCSCNQDFRFIPLIAIPWVSWAVVGWTTWGKSGKRAAIVWGCLLAALQSAFLLSFLITGS